MRLHTLLLLVAAGLSACKPDLPAASADLGSLQIRDGFAYEPVIPASGAAYFRIRNRGTVADTLLSADSPMAAEGMFHGAEMRHLHELPIPPGGELVLKPGGTHLMLSDFTQVPRVGDSLTVVLHFARAGDLTLRLPVRPYAQ